MTYTPLPATPSVPDAAWGQQINDNMAYLFEDRPALVGYVIAQDVLTDDATVLDVSLEAPEAGLYLVTAHTGSTSSPDGGTRRQVRLTVNGTTHAMRQGRCAPNGTLYSDVTDLARLDEGDELGIVVYQDSDNTQTFYARLTAILVAP